MADDPEKRRSVSRATQPEAAAALDSIRVELIVVAIIALGTLMVVVRMDWPAWLELGGAAAVGLGCGGWLAMRRKRTPGDSSNRDGSSDGADQE
jgi:hypothetical protein